MYSTLPIHVKNKDYTNGIKLMERLATLNPEYMNEPANQH